MQLRLKEMHGKIDKGIWCHLFERHLEVIRSLGQSNKLLALGRAWEADVYSDFHDVRPLWNVCNQLARRQVQWGHWCNHSISDISHSIPHNPCSALAVMPPFVGLCNRRPVADHRWCKGQVLIQISLQVLAGSGLSRVYSRVKSRSSLAKQNAMRPLTFLCVCVHLTLVPMHRASTDFELIQIMGPLWPRLQWFQWHLMTLLICLGVEPWANVVNVTHFQAGDIRLQGMAGDKVYASSVSELCHVKAKSWRRLGCSKRILKTHIIYTYSYILPVVISTNHADHPECSKQSNTLCIPMPSALDSNNQAWSPSKASRPKDADERKLR